MMPTTKISQFTIRGLSFFSASGLFGMGIRKGENHKEARPEIKSIDSQQLEIIIEIGGQDQQKTVRYQRIESNQAP